MNFSMYNKFSSTVKNQGIEFAAKTAKDLGFSSVELFDMAGTDSTPTFADVESAKRAKKVLDSYGLSVSCYSVGANLVTIDGQIKRNDKAINDLWRYADIAKALGSHFLHHTLIVNLRLPEGAPTFEEVLMPVVSAACEIADYCKDLGLTCIYEDQGMYFNGVKNFGRFYNEMQKRCDNVGVCGDVGNVLFVDEEPLPFFETFIDDIKHVHIKDYRRRQSLAENEICKLRSRSGIYLESVQIGDGDIDIASCLNLLAKHGYTGALAHEGEFDPNCKESTQRTISFISKHFQNSDTDSSL